MKTLLLLLLALVMLAPPAVRADLFDGTEPISLDLDGVPVATVLNTIAKQNSLNLVVSGDVNGNVTLRLDRVDLRSALDALLLPMGYNYFVKGDVIVVKPFENVSPGELETRTVTLRYVSPVTAQKALEPLKSSQGQVIVLDQSADLSGASVSRSTYQANRLLIADFPSVVKQMMAVIEDIDVQERVISIEARIIETNVDDTRKLGFTWPDAFTAVLGGSDSSSSSSGTSIGSAAAEWNPNNGDFTWAKLSVGQLKLMLDLLDAKGNSKLISDPRVSTLENHEAEIKISTVIPIATINRFTEGAATQDIVTFQDQEVGISLLVVPRVNENGLITMEVTPTVEDIIGYNGPPDNLKPITTERSVRTTITVTDGETAALGGLRKEDDIESTRRVPLLGHIPLLGRLLFTSTSNEKRTTDLIILITPHIVP